MSIFFCPNSTFGKQLPYRYLRKVPVCKVPKLSKVGYLSDHNKTADAS